jgi:hypothetical protein
MFDPTALVKKNVANVYNNTDLLVLGVAANKKGILVILRFWMPVRSKTTSCI